MNGKLASGNIIANMLEGSMTGKQIANLTTVMENGETYVNVHTQQNPNEEIRGQIMMSNSTN
jgi:CHRD domain